MSGSDSHSGPVSETFQTGALLAGGLDQGTEPVDELVAHLNVAVTACSIYPATHPKAAQAVSDLQQMLARYIASEARGGAGVGFNLLVVDAELAIDGKPWRRSQVLCANLLRALEHHSVQRLTAQPGIDASEITDAIVALATETSPVSTPSLEIGKLELLEEGDGDPTVGRFSLENRIDALRHSWDEFVTGAQPSYKRLAGVTRSLLDTTGQTSQQELINPQLLTDGDRLWRHSMGVALSASALASSLGIHGDVLIEITVGALLHDIGLMEPHEHAGQGLWSEWEERTAVHPLSGAGQLALAKDVPALVLLIVYQHHRHHDGSGFPASQAQLNLGSAIVAVADAWQVLFNVAGTMPHAVRWRFAQEQLAEMAGSVLHPDLVALFLQMIQSRPQSRSD